MVAFSTIKPGDRLYEVVRQKMGNTTMRRDAVYDVVIREVHDTYAIASWNGNSPIRYSARQIAKLRRSKPVPKPSIFDRAFAAREATRRAEEE